MTPAETVALLRQFNEWCRGDYEPSEQPAPPDPCEMGEAIDAAIEMIDRLEAAEKERDSTMRLADRLALALNTSNHERDALRARIESMERQEPECEVVGQVRNVLYEVRTLKYDLPAGTKLYALPGAQPAPSVPGGWQLVPVEPTPEMLCALIDGANQYDSWNEGYRDMLAAAPKPEGE